MLKKHLFPCAFLLTSICEPCQVAGPIWRNSIAGASFPAAALPGPKKPFFPCPPYGTYTAARQITIRAQCAKKGLPMASLAVSLFPLRIQIRISLLHHHALLQHDIRIQRALSRGNNGISASGFLVKSKPLYLSYRVFSPCVGFRHDAFI